MLSLASSFLHDLLLHSPSFFPPSRGPAVQLATMQLSYFNRETRFLPWSYSFAMFCVWFRCEEVSLSLSLGVGVDLTCATWGCQ